MESDWLVIGVFVVVYLGMALGRWPGLAIDRTGVAIIGAIVLLVSGVIDGRTAIRFIDFPTIAVLFALMVISAQFAASGFFDWLGARIARGESGRKRLLFHVVLTAGVLASMLTNDVVVWALTPVLVHGLSRGGINPRPYVIALACAANAGSAATVIGNPQNLLIGGHGDLGFWQFLLVCGVPAVLALAVVFGVIAVSKHGVGTAAPATTPGETKSLPQLPILNRGALAKAVMATIAVVVVFSWAANRATWALAIVGVLLLSRKLDTRRMLSMVDWHLLLLFSGLFVVTGAFAGEAGMISRLLGDIASGAGHEKAWLGAISLLGSNTIGNVPLVVFLLSVGPDWNALSLYSLALFSTLSGNFLIVGSVANIIAVERAGAFGVSIGFRDYARIGIPVTLLSLLTAYVWIHLASPYVLSAIGG